MPEVRSVPLADIAPPYSITSSAATSSVGGMVNSRVFATLFCNPIVVDQFHLCGLFDRSFGGSFQIGSVHTDKASLPGAQNAHKPDAVVGTELVLTKKPLESNAS
jgi:hypothetical protein